MFRKIAALTVVCVLYATASVNAAPVVATYDFMTGNVTFSGLTGEIGVTFWANGNDDSLLVRANALAGAGVTLDNFSEGYVSWANFAGFNGTFDGGNIAVPGLGDGTTAPFTVETQVNFTTTGVGTVEVINYIPEPATFVMGGMGLVGMIAVARRRRK